MTVGYAGRMPQFKSSNPTPLSNSIPQPTRQLSPEAAKQELKQAVQGSNDVLCTHSTVLSLFPDTMEIDRAKVTVTKRAFFRTAEVHSISMQDILSVSSSVGPYLGSVIITSRIFNSDQIFNVGKFWRKDAERMARITQGYIIALHRGIDCSTLSSEELVNALVELGADNQS